MKALILALALLTGSAHAASTATPTYTDSPTISPTRTITLTRTPTISPTFTFSRTATRTVTETRTPTVTPTVTPTITPSQTPTMSPTQVPIDVNIVNSFVPLPVTRTVYSFPVGVTLLPSSANYVSVVVNTQDVEGFILSVQLGVTASVLTNGVVLGILPMSDPTTPLFIHKDLTTTSNILSGTPNITGTYSALDGTFSVFGVYKANAVVLQTETALPWMPPNATSLGSGSLNTTALQFCLRQPYMMLTLQNTNTAGVNVVINSGSTVTTFR